MTAYTVSNAGLALIQDAEGFRAEPGQTPAGAWVVGHGHVRAEAGEWVNESEAAHLLSVDLVPVERLVNEKVTLALTQSQFDALVSFAFSIGADAFERSQVLRRVNAGDYIAAACAMDAWRKSDISGELEVVDVLVRRRSAEKAMFLKDIAHEARSCRLDPRRANQIRCGACRQFDSGYDAQD
jgi:lysozyme